VSQAASTSTAGNVNIDSDTGVNGWIVGGVILAVVVIVWLFNRK
jgi:hypothetical protein